MSSSGQPFSKNGEAPASTGSGESIVPIPAHASLFDSPEQALRFLREVEKALLVTLTWMPYPSDVPEGVAQEKLALDLETHRMSLDDVRELRQTVEWIILDKAVV